jgi:cell wall-associated NlpC family hydrolase
VALPRTAQQQYYATVPVPTGQLQPGDLLFFSSTYPSSDWITHVGIYLGGDRMISATAEGSTVAETPAFTGFFGSHFAGGGRVRA